MASESRKLRHSGESHARQEAESWSVPKRCKDVDVF
jgi:hypothetical protein